MLAPSSLAKLTFKKRSSRSPSGMLWLRGSRSEACVKRAVGTLNRNSLDAAERRARVLLGRRVFSKRYRKLQIKLPPGCRKPSESFYTLTSWVFLRYSPQLSCELHYHGLSATSNGTSRRGGQIRGFRVEDIITWINIHMM